MGEAVHLRARGHLARTAACSPQDSRYWLNLLTTRNPRDVTCGRCLARLRALEGAHV